MLFALLYVLLPRDRARSDECGSRTGDRGRRAPPPGEGALAQGRTRKAPPDRQGLPRGMLTRGAETPLGIVHRGTGHAAALAPRARGAKMDVQAQTPRSPIDRPGAPGAH